MPAEGGSQGEAVFARRAFGEARRIPLAAPAGQQPTAAVEVSIAPWGERGERIRFISARLSPESASTRLQQVATLKSSLEGHPSPAILAGNFHCLPGSGPYRLLAEGWFDAARSLGDEAARTYPAKDPEHRADFVFLRPAERWRVVSVQVLDEPIASSHRPLLVEVELLPVVESE
jgi:endonuclease/exonuclease/phosphatase family metal-dependent hydrolase